MTAVPLIHNPGASAALATVIGTVVGMVKTFALITVFGTGNAAKLASGISQVLVATELGLIVAIPALIAHGFLAPAHAGLAPFAALALARAWRHRGVGKACRGSRSRTTGGGASG